MENELSKESKNTLDQIVRNSNDEMQQMLDERARANYATAVAKIYETQVREKELDMKAQQRATANDTVVRKAKIERSGKILESTLRFVGTAMEVMIPAGVYMVCFKEGMEYESGKVFSFRGFTTLRNMIRPKK